MTHTCPVCEAGSLEVFFSMKRVPVIINILSSSKEEALGRPRGDIDLGFCGSCGHIYNTSFNLDLLDYSGEYDNSLHFSATFREFAKTLGESLIQDKGWKNQSLVEVGCGKADFLKMLCAEGGNQGIGFDPSIEAEDWRNLGEKGGRLKLVRGYFGREDTEIPGEKVICQHVLEHIERPAAFLRDIIESRKSLEKHDVYFEVPNVLYTLRDFGIWDIIYEHCSYFSPLSLEFLFNRLGYQVDSCEEVYGKQFLSLHAKYKSNPESLPAVDVRSVKELVEFFGNTYREKTVYWKEILGPARKGEKKAVVWGAGSKGITFLNMMTDGNGIDYIIDQNPAKVGHYVAGTGQRIEKPSFLSDYRPDQVIIMNPLYKEEIAKSLLEMGLKPEILVA